MNFQIKEFEDDLFKEKRKLIDSLSNYVIHIGVISEDTNRKKDKNSKEGLTNAELMFIHERGSKIRHIPKRPVLSMTIEYALKNMLDSVIEKIINNIIYEDWEESDIEKELNKLCIRMQSYCRKIIYSNDGRLAPNAPSTIKAKGDNHPLFDTGQLARSITCYLYKKN